MTTTAANMHGFFLTELMDFATRELGEPTAQRVLREAVPPLPLPLDPTHSCAPDSFHDLARRLAHSAGEPADAWLRRFGAALFARLALLHDVFFVGVESGFDFLAGFERGVRQELRKLDPCLDPPRMETERLGPGRLRLSYRSDRQLAALAHGMLEGCLVHFGEHAVVRPETCADGAVRFLVERTAAAVAVPSDLS
jgi:hypothetical protein